MMTNLKEKINGAFKSITIYFNILMLTAMEFVTYAHDVFQELQPYVPAETYRILALVLIIGNLILRFKTTKSLAEK